MGGLFLSPSLPGLFKPGLNMAALEASVCGAPAVLSFCLDFTLSLREQICAFQSRPETAAHLCLAPTEQAL